MTGGQKSPATPNGVMTKTSPWGAYDEPIEGAEMAMCLGATYVARWTTAHPVQLQKSIEAGIKHKGFSFIEVIAQCPTQSGKSIYGDKDPTFIMNYFKENSYVYKEGMDTQKDKIKCGVLKHDNDRTEYIERMEAQLWQYVESKAKKEKKGGGNDKWKLALM